jgi:hypothetical protein
MAPSRLSFWKNNLDITGACTGCISSPWKPARKQRNTEAWRGSALCFNLSRLRKLEGGRRSSIAKMSRLDDDRTHREYAISTS